MRYSGGFVRILTLIIIFSHAAPTLTSAQSHRILATGVGTNVNILTSGDAELDWIIRRSAEREDVDPRFIHAVIWQESRYRAEAESYQGVTKLMPEATGRFNREHREDIEAGTRYLQWLLKRFNGNVSVALALYEHEKTTAKGKLKGIGPNAFGEVEITQSVTINSEGNYNKLTITDSISVERPEIIGRIPANRVLSSKVPINPCDDLEIEGSGMGRLEVLTVSSEGREVQHKRIYYAPKLNPDRVRKYRQPSSPAVEMLPVGAEFTFWAGDGDDQTPISDKVTITVQPKKNIPIKLQLKDSVASAK